MTVQGVETLRRLREQALDIARSLSDEEWGAPSDCAGWSVRDVYAHMSGVFHGIVDPEWLRTADDPTDLEAGMEVGVVERRGWSTAEVVAEYEQYSGAVADLMVTLQDPPVADGLFPLPGLGTYPTHLLAHALVFDIYCHLRNDVLRPYGPIDRPPPEASEANLRPVLEWMLPSVPQICATELAFVDRPLVLHLEGPGGGEWTAGPDEGAVGLTPGAAPDAAAVVTSGTDEFVRWATKRRPWRDEGVTVTGDDDYGARFCDAVRVY